MKWIFGIALLLSLSAQAQKLELLERTAEVQTKEKNPVTARAALTSQATDKISEDLIKEIIGEAKYNRNRSLIQTKVIRHSARYVPFSKPGELKNLEPAGEGFKMAVTLRISVDDLQKLLLENGLFYESDATPVVLPTIKWVDRVGAKSFSWWSEAETTNEAFLIKEAKTFEESMREQLFKKGFYSLRPLNLKFHSLIPSDFKGDSLRQEDGQAMAQGLGAQIVVEGQVLFLKSQERSDAFQVEMRLSAVQTVNGRVIAEVARQFETDGGAFDIVVAKKMREVREAVAVDLATQILDAWQKGALGGNLYKLVIRGRLPLKTQEAFKEALRNQVREIKNVRERLISADRLVFEVDSALGPKDLGLKAPQIEVGGIKLVLESSSESEAIYRVSR